MGYWTLIGTRNSPDSSFGSSASVKSTSAWFIQDLGGS
jgi:hypothetical protein